MNGIFFPVNIVHFCSKRGNASLQKAFTNVQVSKAFLALYSAGHWELSSSYLYNMHHGWNKYKQ